MIVSIGLYVFPIYLLAYNITYNLTALTNPTNVANNIDTQLLVLISIICYAVFTSPVIFCAWKLLTKK
jgi:hypothetical protein